MKIECKNIHKQNDQPDQTITTKLTAERMVPKKTQSGSQKNAFENS